MRLFLILIIFGASIFGKVFSQAQSNSVFWAVIEPNTQTTSYILGTIHVMDTTYLDFPIKAIETYLDKCNCFVSEVSMSSGLSDKIKLTDADDILNDIPQQSTVLAISHTEQMKLEAILKSSAMFASLIPIIEKIKPQFLAVLVHLETLTKNSDNFSTSNFEADQYFENYAINRGLKISELETAQYQMELLMQPKMSFKDGIIELKQAIKNYDYESEDAFVLYQKQDLESIEAISETPIMIIRNNAMIEKISPLFKQEPTFCAVGAAHLPGKNGLLNLLKIRGFQITPIPIEIRLRR